MNAIESCLLICNIYATTKDVKFLQEDNISYIIKFLQFQFRETIFPSYDAVYTVKNLKKSDNRKKQKSHFNQNRSLHLFYSKCVELIKVLVTLFDKCVFVDTIVLPLSTLAIEPFFVDNIETLQFACLELVTTVSMLISILILQNIKVMLHFNFRFFEMSVMKKSEVVYLETFFHR